MTGDEVKAMVAKIGLPKSKIADDLGRTEQWIHASCRRGCDRMTYIALAAYCSVVKNDPKILSDALLTP